MLRIRNHPSGVVGRRGLLLSSCLLITAACGDILSVNRPDIVQASDLTTLAGLATLRAGAFGEFAKAYGGDASAPGDVRENQILASGLLGDEFKALETDGTRIIYDARRTSPTATNGNLESFYAALHRARSAAETAANTFRTVAPPSTDSVVAEMMNLAGFIYTFLGEDYCSGIRISTLTAAGDVQYGTPLTNAEVFTLGGAKFDTALASATKANIPTLQQLAQVGKARALLNLGQFAAAASAVASVPTTFRYDVRYSSTTARQQNGVFYANNQLKRWSMVNRKGGNGIDYQDAFTAGDPRTPWTAMPGDGLGFDKTAGPGFNQGLYASLTASIPLATGIEARLIEAEAALQANNVASFQSIHNALRASLGKAAVGPIDAAAMTPAQRVDFHLRERALWLYATGHRLGDMRRLIRQYGRTENTVFPTGPYYRPTYPTYGTDVNFPVPISELNNPNWTACLDRKA